MKRFKILLLIFGIFSVLGMIGCGTSKEENSVTREENNQISENQSNIVPLTVWGADKDQDMLKEMVEQFRVQYQDQVQLEITVEVMNEDNCREVLLSDVYNGADVFAFADDQLLALAAGGVLEPIEEADKIKAENVTGAVEAASIQDKLYAYPLTADNGYFLYYNKEYFTNEDVKELDTMLKIAEKENKQIMMDWSSGWYFYSFFGNTGLTLGLNDDNVTNYCDWNSKEGEIKGVDVAKAIQDIVSNPVMVRISDKDFVQGMKKETIIAGISGIWNAQAIEEALGDNYGAVKLPTYTVAKQQIQMSSYAGYKMIGVNSYSKNKEWATKLANWLTNEENQMIRFVKRGQGPSNIKAAESEEIAGSLAIQALIQQSEYASLQRVGNKYWSAVTKFCDNLWQNKPVSETKLQKMLDDMVVEITADITQ